MKDVAKGRNFKKLFTNGENGGLELSNKAKTQIGGGQNWKRKRVIKNSDYSKR